MLPEIDLYIWHPKTIRNDVSHNKLEQPAQKLYEQKVCGGHLAFPATYLQGCLGQFHIKGAFRKN